MTKVLVTQSKLDTLAEIVGGKSNTNVPLTLDEMITAADSITSGGGTPTLETVTKTYTPSTSAVTDTITPSAGYDGIEEVDVTVSAVPLAVIWDSDVLGSYETVGGSRKFKERGVIDYNDGGFVSGNQYTSYTTRNAIASGTSVTPTESAQTIGGNNYMMEGAVTVNAIPSNYVGSGVTQRTSSDLSASGATVTAPSGYYASNATKTVSSGTAGTPTASKGAVNNHAISVTPSVTNTTGYITGGTKTGTAVSVSASEVCSGTLSITSNGTSDCTNYASVSVNVSGGGGSSVQVGFDDTELSSASSSISFVGVGGEPTSFVLWATSELATGASPFKVAMVVYDGTNIIGQTITNTNNAQVTYDSSSFSYTYNNGTLTVTSTGAYFQPTTYFLDFSYDGSSANVKTADVQVGSGATSITFTGLEDEPVAWSCIFKSDFSTSSGYQRVIGVMEDGEGIYGLEMDSSAKYSTAHWSASYNNGSLTITSQGTNAGGYFHQPGYYQLTYVIADASPYEKKSITYRASTSAQTDKIEPSSGYDAMSEVNISIPAVTQTNLTAGNIKSGTTVTISNGQSNLWSVTGTYGGGGSSMNVQTNQSTSRTSATSLTSVNSLTCSTSGTYDVYWTCTRSSTSGTWSSRLYVGGTASGSEQSTWSNHVQTVKLTGVTINANQTVAVYVKTRGSNYYGYAPQLTIVQTA